MNRDCADFRHSLEERLAGRADPPQLAPLNWHAHLHTCEDCRALFRAEEALEILLASLPEPQLPPDVAARVLLRLRAGEREEQLDALLDMDADSRAPAGLASRVLAGLNDGRTDERLDRALELAGAVDVPDGLAERVLAGLANERQTADPLERWLAEAGQVDVPVGLSGRVLAGLASEREAAHASEARGRFQLLQSPMVRRVAAAVIATAALAGALQLFNEKDATDPGTFVANVEEPDEGLLANLDLLEELDELQDLADEDLAMFHSFDAGDEALLDYRNALGATDGEGR